MLGLCESFDIWYPRKRQFCELNVYQVLYLLSLYGVYSGEVPISEDHAFIGTGKWIFQSVIDKICERAIITSGTNKIIVWDIDTNLAEKFTPFMCKVLLGRLQWSE